MKVAEYLKETFKPDAEYQLRDRIVCVDGYTVSVQGNTGAYCTPRIDTDEYSAVELGFPSEGDALINHLKECVGDEPTETVYPYVNIDTVEKLIEKHGGIDVEKTLNQKAL